MNKRIILGWAGTMLFVLAFLLGKTTAVKAQDDAKAVKAQDDAAQHAGKYWSVVSDHGMTLSAVQDTNGVVCYYTNTQDNFSCVRP